MKIDQIKWQKVRLVPFTLFAVFVLTTLSLSARAAIDTYEFVDEETRARFHVLNAELRCPKCQNQNLADSNAPIALDLRAEVYRMLTEEKTNREIKDYLVDRYGEYVLYKPEWSAQTWLLWLAPVIFLALGLTVLFVIVKRRGNIAGSAAIAPELSNQEQQRIDQLLQPDSSTQEKES